MRRIILNEEHLETVFGEALRECRHRLFIATADLKDLHVPSTGTSRNSRRGRSILQVLDELGRRNIETRLLHSGVPSTLVLRGLKAHRPENLVMRRCPRTHAKAVIVDGRRMYLGSANLTGAGLGAKSPRRRNFEAGIWTDDLSLIDPVADMLEGIWSGRECTDCGRRDYCPVPLEEPNLSATC